MTVVDKIKSLGSKSRKAADELRWGVEDLRTRRVDLIAEREKLESALMSKSEVEANIDRALGAAERDARDRSFFVDFALQDQGAKPLGRLFRIASIIVPPSVVNGNSTAGTVAGPTPVDVIGGLCVLGQREAIRTALVSETLAAAKATGLPIMDAAEREAEAQRIEQQIDIVERSEEALIRAAEEAGLSIGRRRDARAEILLAVEL